MEADKHTLTGSSQAWYIADRTVSRIMHSVLIAFVWALVIIAHVKGLGMHAVWIMQYVRNMNHADCIS